MAVGISVGTLRLDVPLLNGSGAVDVVSSDDDWNLPIGAVRELGGFVTKTLTRDARAGHPHPWADTVDEHSLINAVGLANPGIDAALAEWRTLPAQLGLPIIVSIGGDVGDLPELARRVDDAGWASAIELNLSCPNVHGGLVAGDPAAVEAAVHAVRSVTRLPLFAKLTPACGSPREVARRAEAAGADALTCGNTMPIRWTSADGAPVLGAGAHGGLSGRALHPIALHLVSEAASVVSIPVVGLGGVDSEEAARRMLDAGARIVGVGTGAVLDPTLLRRLATLLR
ncbi:MAG: dihydroorotate dehydrogenase catalytic subunit [Thermoleophilia bacterium]|nr:dihydroorotate dehydrogenase catalytic subunit [Thermoleophilia bacterium]